MCDELLEVLVCRGQRFPQDGLQPSKEGNDVQAVEGEAAGERQQAAGPVDGPRRRVPHHVSIDGAAEGRCRRTQGSKIAHDSASVSGDGRLSRLTRGPEGQVVVGAGDPDVRHHGGVRPLRAAVSGGAGGGARVERQRRLGEILAEGLKFICEEETGRSRTRFTTINGCLWARNARSTNLTANVLKNATVCASWLAC